MLAITSPFPQYFDADGSPLDSGKLYIGSVDQDPQTNPITVYWDIAGTIAAEQPIRTLNGYPARNGTPALLYANTSYSLNVRNRRNMLVAYVPNSATAANSEVLQSLITAGAASLASATGASLVGYFQRSILDKFSDDPSIFDKFTSAEVADALSGTPVIDTTAKVLAAINAASGKCLWFEGTTLTVPMPTSIAVDDIKWRGRNGARILLKPGTYPAGWHFFITGARPSITDIEFDGNMPAMTLGQGTHGLCIDGASPTLVRVKCRKSVGRGYTLYSRNASLVGTTTSSVRKGQHTDCNFDDNAGLGMETLAASYHDFTDCTWDRNGYGFQKTRQNYADTTHDFAAFGFALRYRSHHIYMLSPSMRDNGRDGGNFNQGSFACTIVRGLAHGNDDGGITVSADETGTGLPGESESCYDLDIDVDAYNNYGSGIALYSATHNSKFRGRSYNNHRCAGEIGNASSIYSGIYVAAGSTGIDADINVYDDRQFKRITSVSGGVLSPDGWTPGSMLYYPRVAIYSSTLVFQGYGSITAEASGSVTIVTSANNGVVIGSITSGMYVTQAVQHVGVFVDNNCNATVSADGFGHQKGVDAFSGQMVFMGYFAGQQNSRLKNGRKSGQELLLNGTFDSNVANWTFSLVGGGTAVPFTGTPRQSAGALQLNASGTASAYGDATLAPSALQAMQGNFVEYECQVYSDLPGAQIILFTQATAFSSVVTHRGGGWQTLVVGLQVNPSDAGVTARVVTPLGQTAIFDTASLQAVYLPVDNREFISTSRYLPL